MQITSAICAGREAWLQHLEKICTTEALRPTKFTLKNLSFDNASTLPIRYAYFLAAGDSFLGREPVVAAC
ncbi:hypothetical protein NTG1052_210099 [Candidatus Nitrotoga sp. 1052]|nr:hypothetical protein NTG1052_210099 [Candidatus Nitrotoga sp. 1052]